MDQSIPKSDNLILKPKSLAPHRAGSILFRPGEENSRILVLMNGSVAIASSYLLEDDPDHRVVHAGEVIHKNSNTTAFTMRRHLTAYAVCLEDCEIAVLPKVMYDQMLEVEAASEFKERLALLQKLPWFDGVPAGVVQRALYQHSVSVKSYVPRALVCSQGQSLDQVRCMYRKTSN